MKLKLKLRLPGKKGAIIIGVAVLLLGGTGGALHFLGPRGGVVHAALEKVGLAKPLPETDELTEDQKQAKLNAAEQKAENSNPALAARSDIIRNVRALQLELTSLAQGDPDGGAKFKKSMIDMRNLLRGKMPEELDPAEIDALVIYLLSGGTPELVRKATAASEISTRRRALLDAAMAYVSDNPKDATDLLKKLDPKAFPDPIAARLNMMYAQLNDTATFEERRAYLVQALMHSLGTLVEEAATRRLVSLSATKLKRIDFVYWASRYQRRFPKSLYYSDFTVDFVKGILALEKNKTPVSDIDLELLVNALPDARKVAVMSDVQAGALRSGYKRLCGFAYGKISRLAAEGTPEMARAKLYQAACNVDGGAESLDSLGDFNPSSFSMEDVEVLRAATSLASGIAQQVSTPEPPVYGPQVPYDDFETVKKLNASVAQQLESTTKALKGIPP